MFNPLGNFNAHAPIDAGILAKARELYTDLPNISPLGISRIYYHWTVSTMGACFDDYNIEALFDATWHLKVTHDLRDNSASGPMSSYAAHTFHRNKGAVGIAITGMDGATVHDFGADGVTVTGLTHLCAAGAAVAKKYDIDTLGLSSTFPYRNEWLVMTHAEAAMLPGSPPQYEAYGVATTSERWDLASFVSVPADVTLTPDMAHDCGDALRLLTHKYRVML